MKYKDYCGCCGREHTGIDYNFCADCLKHVGPPHLAPWDRCYSAMHGGEPCPFQIFPEPEGSPIDKAATTNLGSMKERKQHEEKEEYARYFQSC